MIYDAVQRNINEWFYCSSMNDKITEVTFKVLREVDLDFRTSGMTCRSSIPFVDFQDDPGTIVLGFYDGSRALAGMGS